MTYKKISLFLAEIVVVVLLYTIPSYRRWFDDRIVTPGFTLNQQIEHMGIEERKELRYGHSYIIYKDIVTDFRNIKGAIVLLPPNDYLREMGLSNVEMPEPALFYYFTGVNAVTAGSLNAGNANWAVTVKEYGSLWVKKLNSQQQVDSLLWLYKQYNN